MSEKLYQYYDREGFFPTHGVFSDAEDLRAYAHSRRNIFADKLRMPPRLFRDANMLEFGPDTGENALVAAIWGANCTLVEPHLHAHQKIREYFKNYDLSDRLVDVVGADVEGFETSVVYDIILAEGFVYTIQPSTIWLSKFNPLLTPGGLCVASYYERSGAFMELCLKAIFYTAKSMSSLPSDEVAWALYENKWESIPHVRAFSSWVKDVLTNPFVRSEYFIDAGELCQNAHDCGLNLYASWPVYRDPLDIYWHKTMLSPEKALAAERAHTRRSRLSFFSGRNHYIASSDEAFVTEINDAVDRAVAIVDGLAHDDASRNAQSGQKLQHVLQTIRTALDRGDVVGSSDSKKITVSWLDSLMQAFEHVFAADYDALRMFTNADESFIANWGMPAHYAVFEKPY